MFSGWLGQHSNSDAQATRSGAQPKASLGRNREESVVRIVQVLPDDASESVHHILQEAISKCDMSPEAVCKMLDATKGDATVEEGSVVDRPGCSVCRAVREWSGSQTADLPGVHRHQSRRRPRVVLANFHPKVTSALLTFF